MPRLSSLLAAIILLVGLPHAAGAQKLDAACVNLELLNPAQKYATSDLRAAVAWKNWSDAAFSAQQLKNVEEPHAFFWFAWLVLEGHMRGDLNDAVARMRRVAEHGCPLAQSAYSLVYAKGTGVPQDWVQAYKWATLAAAKGDPGGIKLRDDIAQRQPDVVAPGKRLAADFQPTAW